MSGRDAFEVVILGEDCARPKPHPDPYQKALEVLGLQPHEAIVIEDSPFGAAAWTTYLLRHLVDNMLSHAFQSSPARAFLFIANLALGVSQLESVTVYRFCHCVWRRKGEVYVWRTGVAAGSAAGIPVVGMLTSQTAERLKSAGAVQCVNNYRELLALAPDAPSPAMQAA